MVLDDERRLPLGVVMVDPGEVDAPDTSFGLREALEIELGSTDLDAQERS